MSVVTLNLTQSTANTVAQQHATADNDTLADDVQLFFGAALAFASTHGANNTPAHNSNGDLVLNYADGAVNTVSGLVLAPDGKATASGFTDSLPGMFELKMGGAFSYNYGVLGGALSLLNGDATITNGSFKTTYNSGDANYDPKLGNATLGFTGSVHSSPLGAFSGVINRFTGGGDHFLTALDASGAFNISGNSLKVGLLQESAAVSGMLHAYHAHYEDGSTIAIDDAAIPVSASSSIDVGFALDGANFSGNDVFNVTMPATLATAWVINGGDGDDTITLNGGGSNLSALGGNGNDTIVLTTHGHHIDGGAGADMVVLAGARSSYQLQATGNGYQISQISGGAGSDTLSSIERIQFSDGAVALDAAGNAGQAYRIYQAAFDRAPDAKGLGFWISALDRGASLRDVASAFTQSSEFKSLYGAAPANSDFLNSLYHNVLHRDGDAGGFAWWLDKLDTHAASFTDLLVSFSESAENQAALAPAVSGGIPYIPWG